MQLHTLLFLGSQVAASGYALARGGLPERIVAIELLVAALVGSLATTASAFQTLQWSALALDLTLFAALLPIAMRANRFWPLWVAAVQLDTIAVHGVRVFDPSMRPSVYFVMAGYAAYPILLLLALGTLRHREREARAGTGEAAWIT